MTEDAEAASHCPTCGAEYRAGFDVCADDGTPLEPGPAPETIDAPPPQEPAPAPVYDTGARWIRVATYTTQEEARLAVGRLEAEGITALTDPPIVIGSYYGPAVEVLLRQGMHVVVPEDRALEARALLEELNRS